LPVIANITTSNNLIQSSTSTARKPDTSILNLTTSDESAIMETSTIDFTQTSGKQATISKLAKFCITN
jgi:hypothetical protein